jgi:K+-transporting ATPase KdpF subunit
MTLFYWIVGGIALLLLLYLFAAMLKPEMFS